MTRPPTPDRCEDEENPSQYSLRTIQQIMASLGRFPKVVYLIVCLFALALVHLTLSNIRIVSPRLLIPTV